MKRTIHDGSRSYSVTIPDPEPGNGKHAKTEEQKIKRHKRNVFLREMRLLMIKKGE